MSSIVWSGDRLIQRIRSHEEELGYVRFEPSSNTCVLWLKDTFGVATTAGAYIRADEYPSLDAAKAVVLDAPSVFIWHLIWMRSIVKREAEQELDDHWEEVRANAKVVPNKEDLKDRIRAHLDRLSSDKIKDLFQNVAERGLTQWVIEFVKNLFV